MAKGPQGLLNAGTPSHGLLAVSGVTAEVARGGGAVFCSTTVWGSWGAPGLFGCNYGRPARPARALFWIDLLKIK
jgi:hypothetical protein